MEYQVAVGEWSEVLGGLSAEEIRHGLENWKGDFPPNVFEFYNTCRTWRPEAHKPFDALPLPKPDPDLAKNAIGKMREALK